MFGHWTVVAFLSLSLRHSIVWERDKLYICWCVISQLLDRCNREGCRHTDCWGCRSATCWLLICYDWCRDGTWIHQMVLFHLTSTHHSSGRGCSYH